MNDPVARSGVQVEPSSQRERRTHPRVRCVIGATCRWETGAETVGLVMDISVGGARVAFWQALDPPLQGKLRFRTTEGKVLEVSARSAHTERTGNRWLVGYQFDQPLTADQLAALMG